MQQFAFLVPSSLDETLAMMAEHAGHCQVVAGGTDIVPALREDRLPGVSVLIDIRRRPELRGIKKTDHGLWIGAGTTHSEIVQSPEVRSAWRLLADACGQVGSKQIRNLATVGGNVANASPAADSIPALLCLDARVSLMSVYGQREVFLQAYLAEKKPGEARQDELLTGFMLPYSLPNTMTRFVKVARRQAMAISRLSLAMAVHVENGVTDLIRLVPGAMLPVTQRLVEVENFLTGRILTPEISAEAAKLASAGVIAATGMRSSFKYKVPVLEGLIKQVLEQFREGVENYG